MTKIQPAGKKMDNLNFDVVNAFALGCQFIMNHPHTFDINSLIY